MTLHKCTAALLRAKCLPQPFGSCHIPAGLLCKTCVQLHTRWCSKIAYSNNFATRLFCKAALAHRVCLLSPAVLLCIACASADWPTGPTTASAEPGSHQPCGSVNICTIRSVGKRMLGCLVWHKMPGLRLKAALPDRRHAFNLMRGCCPLQRRYSCSLDLPRLHALKAPWCSCALSTLISGQCTLY